MENEAIIHQIVEEIELNLDIEKLHQSSFHVFLLDMVTNVMNVVENLESHQPGEVKKQIVIKVGETIIMHHFPAYINYYHDNVGIIIELVIRSYYMLKESKALRKCLKSCLPCMYPKTKH
jgi:hypothetical protein